MRVTFTYYTVRQNLRIRSKERGISLAKMILQMSSPMAFLLFLYTGTGMIFSKKLDKIRVASIRCQSTRQTFDKVQKGKGKDLCHLEIYFLFFQNELKYIRVNI